MVSGSASAGLYRRRPGVSADLLASQGADAVAELGGVLEVEPPRGVLHLRVQLADAPLEVGRRVEGLLRGRLDLHGVVVALVHRLQQVADRRADRLRRDPVLLDRKSTRLNSSHGYISYAVFCLKKKTTKTPDCSD